MLWFKGVTPAVENRHTLKMCLGNRANMWRMRERENLIIANFLFFFFFKFYFIFKLYITVLDLPNIKMNPPQVYMCSPSWTFLKKLFSWLWKGKRSSPVTFMAFPQSLIAGSSYSQFFIILPPLCWSHFWGDRKMPTQLYLTVRNKTRSF